MSMTFSIEELTGEEDYVNMSNSNAYMVWQALGLTIDPEGYYWTGLVGDVVMACVRWQKGSHLGDSLDLLSYKTMRINEVLDLCLKAKDPQGACSIG